MIKPLYALVYSLAVSLLLISGEVAAKQTSAVTESEKARVLVWGDSLSAAYGIPQEKGWVSLLQERFKDELEVVNASISGETTQGGLTRLPDALEQHKPTLLLLELGANDGLRGFKTELIEENLQRMIEMSLAADAKVVLLGIRIPLNYGFTYTQKFEKIYVDLAEKFQLPLLPFLLEPVALDYDLMQADGLHPTADAQPKVLEHVLTLLTPELDKLLASKDAAAPQTISDSAAEGAVKVKDPEDSSKNIPKNADLGSETTLAPAAVN